MPHKLPYKIVGSTGEVEGYPAKNLEEHSPTVAGWQTQRFCVYPQELVIKLSGTVRLKKLQLLAHQYMIPSKIEFYVSDSSQSFKRLGYIYLSSNEKTGYKSRELKSVHVDTEGSLIKLILHKNHLNKFNMYNQVSLMAFNIIGENLDRAHQNEYADVNPAYSNPDYISPMDDLAFDMYQDPYVASIIRKLDVRKYQCVKDENFDMAKKIKQAISDLRKVGEKLARYELDKQKAIEEEDYDLAKSKKSQMEEYRIKISQQLQNYGLLGEAGVSGYPQIESLRRPVLPEPTSPEIANTSIERIETPHESRSQEIQEPLSPVYSNEEIKQSISAPEISLVEEQHMAHDVRVSYDDKIIPALQKSTGENQENIENIIDTSLSEAQGRVPGGEPEPMSEKSIREAAAAIDVFGLNMVSGAYSKNFSFREDALLSIYKKMKDPPAGIHKDELHAYLHAALLLLRRLIKDQVHSVFLTSLRLLELILVHFIPTHKLGKSEVAQVVHQTLPLLIHRTGDSAARQRASSIDFITKMGLFPNVKSSQIVPQTATQPFTKDMATRLALGRIEIVKRLIEALGLGNSALTTDNVMRFCMPALEHTSGEVREAASKVIHQVYRIKGEVVKKYLPPDEPATRKNLLYRNLFDEFDHIDGKPTKVELKAQREAEALKIEKKKKDEINQLQSQIEHLRAVNSKLNTTSNIPKAKSTAHPVQKEGDIQRPSEDGDESSSTYLENMCIFCGEHDDSFNNEGLDLHYWKNCPMLKRCEHCKQVVEIAGYSDHLVAECDLKGSFTKCSRCSEAIPKDSYQRHTLEKKCLVNKPDKQNRCPMCHRNIPLGEETWKQHLMGSGKDACTENARRVPALNHMKTKESQKKGGTRTGNKKA